MERSNSGAAIVFVFLLVSLYLFPFFPTGESKEELVDWASTVSLVEANSFDISEKIEIAGIEASDDLIKTDGGVYSKRAPGLTFLSAPIYALTRVFLGEPTKENVRTSWFILRFSVSTLPLLLLGFWLYTKELDSYSMTALLFATPLFPYSLLYYSHVLVAILVYLAFRMLYDSRRVSPETCFSASALLGFAFTCDYLAAIPAIIFGLGLLNLEGLDRGRRLLFFFAGFVPGLMLLGIYNFFVFGSPVAFLNFAEIAIPSLTSVYSSLVSPSQGVFVFAPILILGFLGIFTSNEGGTKRHMIKAWAIIITILAGSGTALAYGDNSIGPRHMILVVPLLLDSLFDGEIEEYPSHWRGLMLVVSFAFCTIPMLTYPFAPTGLQFPHNSYWMPMLLNDEVFANTLINTYGIGISIWTMLPLIVLFVISLFLVWRDSKYPMRFGLGMLIGVGLLLAYFFSVPLESKQGFESRKQTQTIVNKRTE